MVRESLRLAALDITQLYAKHARAAAAGGMGMFLAFVLINGAVVVFAVRVGLKASRRTQAEQETV